MNRSRIRMPEYSKTRDTIDRIKESREFKEDPENQSEVLRLERKFETIRAKSDFLQQDYVRDVVRRLKSVILSITRQLQEEDDPKKRMVLKCDRMAYRRVLTWFSDDIEHDLEEIADRAETMLG